jgi:predicted permease
MILETTWQDVRHAGRSLGRSPAFTLTALVTVALGVGATAAVFSVVNAVLLRPPPYPEAHRVLVLSYPDGGAQDGRVFHYVREHTRGFLRVAAHGSSSGWNLVVRDHAEYVKGLPVSAGLFEVLGVAPMVGRGFSDVEDQAQGPRAVVLSEPLWRRLFGARAEAIGETVRLGGVPHAIVGVMPAGFRTSPPADLWTPLRLSPTDNSWNYTVLGRLHEGTSAHQAAAELATLKGGIHRDLRGMSERRSQALQWIAYQRWLGLAGRDELLLLLGAVVFLLLIVCANVAGLQVVRAVTRRREMATRAALGGGRARLVRLALSESLLLALVGGVLGVLAARWSLQTLLTLVPGGLLEGRTVDLDWRVLGVALAAAVAAGTFSGLAPAVGTARLDLRAALSEAARSTEGRSAMWWRRIFAVAEIALAVVLLVGAGLLIRTFVNLRRVELGFDPSNVVIGKMSLQGSTSQAREETARFFERTLVRLRDAPGVTAAAVGNNVPVEQGLNLPLEPPPQAQVDEIRAVDWRYVTPEYFVVFGILLRAGRAFDDRDHARGVPTAIVNEAFARTYFGTARVVGRLVRLERGLKDPPREIVGVVADVKGLSGSGWTTGLGALGSPAAPTMYVPVAQVPDALLQLVHHFFPVSWAVRTRGADTVAAVKAAVRSVDPRLPFIRFETMEEVIARDLETQRFLMMLLGVFAAVAVALATVGMFGLAAYAAARRTREAGIRMALGATAADVARVFLGESLSIVVVGVAIGIAGATLAGRLLSALVFGIEPVDPVTFVGVTALVTLVTGAAALMPAVQASRTEPLRALRPE